LYATKLVDLTDFYALSLHDALPILFRLSAPRFSGPRGAARLRFRLQRKSRLFVDERFFYRWPFLGQPKLHFLRITLASLIRRKRSEEHTSELQSRGPLVCRLLLDKK